MHPGVEFGKKAKERFFPISAKMVAKPRPFPFSLLRGSFFAGLISRNCSNMQNSSDTLRVSAAHIFPPPPTHLFLAPFLAFFGAVQFLNYVKRKMDIGFREAREKGAFPFKTCGGEGGERRVAFLPLFFNSPPQPTSLLLHLSRGLPFPGSISNSDFSFPLLPNRREKTFLFSPLVLKPKLWLHLTLTPAHPSVSQIEKFVSASLGSP